MKKLMMILLSAALAFSCGDMIEIPDVTDETPETPGTNPGGETPAFDGKITFSATFEALSDGTQPSWAGGDNILLYDGFTAQTLTNTADFGTLAKFPATVNKEAKAYLAVAPAADGLNLEGTKVTFTLPATRSLDYDATLYSVAKSTGNQLFFRPLMSMVSYTVNVEGATKVVFKTVGGEKIAGEVSIDYTEDTPVVAAVSDQVEITGNFEKGKLYSFAVPAGDISGYTAVVYVGETEKAHITGDAVELAAGLGAQLPAFTSDIPTYQIVALQLWGGTGPEYNCSKVYDILKKPGCFNNEDGRGIEALLDNYYLLKDDGTFINYAGEDGRNWWFVYSGEQNPANHKDVDLRAMYDLLPLSEGKWSSEDGQNITFTMADGTTTSAILAPAGTYTMPGTSPELSVTTTHLSLVFDIKGGKDNWDFPWQDYGVIACRPRKLFIELEKMPDGFVVPEASRTTDADFEYVAPIEPDKLFDWDGFAAHWNVYGGNSAPYGISVLGGSGDDPAFVSPIDKSWDWNDSIGKESDNGLVIKVTSKTDAEIKGTTNWWSGNDGGFWDYVWKGTGESLANFYDKIPKGEKEFTLDFATMTITLGNGNQAKFLTPGTHEFVYGKTWEVPDGCFALAFHLMDPIAATSQRWTDVDRFVNAPLEYVIMFEK